MTYTSLKVKELANGKWLLDEVCRRQEVLPEIEYFGLRYISCELLSAPTKHWLKLTKPIRTQLKHTHPRLVSFRIKHYPPDPFNDLKLDKSKYVRIDRKLHQTVSCIAACHERRYPEANERASRGKEGPTVYQRSRPRCVYGFLNYIFLCRYLLFHQLHRDFLGGRLIAPHDDLIRLAALFLQVTLGDASVIEASFAASQSSFSSGEASTYLSNYRALHGGSSRKTEIEIVDEHRKLEGLLPSEAAAEVIRAALRQPSYGLEPFRVLAKHKKSRPMHVGLTHEGVAEFIGSKRVQLYKWYVHTLLD
ncbi:unnamed protein product [Mesocestoides corti]|uniref:FERM domain-containing protein n=1 Tax=Mesocestoides corti TaxID=53468 RepID=A0A0R3U9A0_MESCO|nr:unnamed protein product [Mesocestoides corti]